MAKPVSHIDWTDGDPAKVEEPGVPKKLSGWFADERISFKFLNFNFFRVDEWLKYFETTTDSLLLGAGSFFDAIVGTGAGTVGNLNLAVAAAPADGRIFVKSHPPLTDALGVQTISKNGLEVIFGPAAVIDQTETLVNGIIVSADRCKIIRPRFTNWDNAGGDRALKIDGKNTLVDYPQFFNSVGGFENNGANNTIRNAILEV